MRTVFNIWLVPLELSKTSTMIVLKVMRLWVPTRTCPIRTIIYASGIQSNSSKVHLILTGLAKCFFFNIRTQSKLWNYAIFCIWCCYKENNFICSFKVFFDWSVEGLKGTVVNLNWTSLKGGSLADSPLKWNGLMHYCCVFNCSKLKMIITVIFIQW